MISLLPIFFFFVLVPFVSPIPLATDVQPVFFIMGALVIALQIKRFRVSSFELTLLCFGIFALININFESFSGLTYHLRKSIGLIFIFPVVLIFSRFFDRINYNDYLFAITFLLCGSFLQIAFSSVYYDLGDTIFNNKIVHLGLRGWKSFTPEPINLAMTALAISILSFFSFKINVLKTNQFAIIFVLSLLLALGTLSATALLFFVILVLVYFSSKITIIKNILALFFFSICFIIFYYFPDDFRSVNIFIKIFTDPFYIISNTSLFYRVFHNIVAVLYYLDNPSIFGLGVASFDVAATYVSNNYDLIGWFPSRIDWILDQTSIGFGKETKNFSAQLIIEHGFVGILFYIIVIKLLFKQWTTGITKFALVFFIIVSIQSTPLVFPLTWALIGANTYIYYRDKNK